jgi:hypothetical protein
MHSTALVQEIDRLLRESTLRQREIAARLNVSRGTVSAIASGRRGLYGKERDETHSPLIPTSLPARCPRCGYRVYPPCIICRIRELRARQLVIEQLAAERPRNGAADASPRTAAKPA